MERSQPEQRTAAGCSVDTRLLVSLPIFRGLDRAEGRALCEKIHVAVYEPDAVLFGAGSEAVRALYVVLNGTVELVKPTKRPDGRAKRLARLGPGSVLCETNLLVPAPRTLTARTTSPVVLATLDADAFAELAAEHATCALKVAMNIGRAVTRRMRKLKDLCRDVAEEAERAAPASSRPKLRNAHPGDGGARRVADLDRFRQQVVYEWQFE